MSKKLLCFSILFLIITFTLNVSNATNIAPISDTTNAVDNTLYSPVVEEQDTITDTDTTTYGDAATTTTADYESETELSISNIINIVLISVGIVLILLGIAIIIKLK